MRLPNSLRIIPRLRLPPPPATRTLLVCAALAMAGFIAICGVMLLDARRDAAQRTGTTASQLASAVAQAIAHSINFYDGALQALVEGLHTPGVRDLSPQLRNLVLFDRVADTRYLGFIEALDASGDAIASYPPVQHATNWANRDYFIAHHRDASLGLHVSRPFATAQEEFASIAFSRRMADADGNFAGVVVIGLRLAYFRELFSKLELGPNGSITLLRDDGSVLMHMPFDRNEIGRVADAASPFGTYMRTGAAQLAASDAAEHVERQFAFRRIGDLPLVLSVGLARDSFYAVWWFVGFVTAGAMLLAVALVLLRRLGHELQQREAAERENRGKSSLLATLSHELRTPLHGILGYAEQLSTEGRLDPAQSRRVASIISAGQHMRSVVDWALDYAWIEARGPELHMRRVELRPLLEQCRAIVEPSATARGLRLHCTVAPNLPRCFVTDAALLRQILLNLLDNAVKFTRKGGVEVRLALVDDQIAIEVMDTGIGIPAEQRHKLFHEYERLGAEHSAVAGVGLGLAIAARLVRRMGGDIGYREKPGGGSVFWIMLPPGGADRSGAPQADGAAALSPGRLRVLVADDTAASREIATAFLQAEGHEVLQATDGVEAVQLATAEDVDVVLMDMRMTGIDGLEATRQIRAIDGPRGRVPIIAMTANALDWHVAECLLAGMVAHLPKPFGPRELSAVIALAAARHPDERPAIDPDILGQLARCMSADALDAQLRGLSQRIEAFQCKLAEPDALANPELLADMAHDLAGSAGTLGLAQLSAAAHRFQNALEADPAQARRLHDEMGQAAEAARDALRRRTLA